MCLELTDKNKMKNILISIILPVYNVEEYINECLKSLINQTLYNIEIILVDDGSTDKSGNICDEYAKKDSRVKIIHQKNQGSLQARRNGILQANGKYILFVDPDDFIAKDDSIEKIYNLIEKEKVDILQFSIDVIDLDEKRRKNTLKWMKVCQERIDGGRNIISSCFSEGKFGWNLWNKIYKSEICKKSALNINSDINLYAGTDIYPFFLMAFFANSFIGVVTEPFYVYRRNDKGITSKKKVTIDSFKHTANEINIVKLAENFLKSRNIYIEYEDIIKVWKKRSLGFPMARFRSLIESDASKGFDLLIKNYPITEVITSLWNIYKGNQLSLINRVKNSEIFIKNKKNIKTIGIFYHRYNGGGVQRVISLQIPLFIRMGLKVVFFTEEYDAEGEYNLDESVSRVILPLDIKERSKKLLETIKYNKIDVMLYHAASSNLFLFDLLVVKSQKIPFIATCHELTVQTMSKPNIKVTYLHELYKLTDLLLVLSHMEEAYYKSMGVNAIYLPNQVQFRNSLSLYENNEGIILWVGRLDENQKNYRDALEIMKVVAHEKPDAKMIMLGREYTKNSGEIIRSFISDNNLESNIEWHGNVKNVEDYYKKAKIVLMTSSYESFPMVIIESKSFGIPLVTYSMPYLELLKDGRGYIEVPQRDIEHAAEEIIGLLNNDELCKHLSDEARNSIRQFSDFNHLIAWKNIIRKIEDNALVNDIYKDNYFKLFMETLFFHYGRGVDFYEKEANKLKILSNVNKKVIEQNELLRKKDKWINNRESVIKSKNNEINKAKKKIKDQEKFIKELKGFSIWKYLKYKLTSKLTFGEVKRRHLEKYKNLKSIYRKIS